MEPHEQGWAQRAVAEALGVTQGAASQWLKRVREGGVSGLRHHPAPGPYPKLTDQQRPQIPSLVARGAEAYGFGGEVWITARVAAMIQMEFGVAYHAAHASRLLRAIGWGAQRPAQRATQRDEAAIQAWYRKRWPRLKKGLLQRGEPSYG